jgi:hypothetical protein
MAFQQNVETLTIAVIVLHAPPNRLADLRLLVPQLLAALDSAKPGVRTVSGTP